MNKSKTSPFDRIGIGLSGGGYRATAFHLGVLSYLNHLNFKKRSLLQSVKVISTVSGGTFTGMVYAQQLAQGKDFKACYALLYNSLQNVNLVEEALAKLKGETKWNNNYKNRNLINAFSELYDEHFTQGEMFGLLRTKLKDTHLDEVIFNATEFNTGNAFKFKTRAKFGSTSFTKFNKHQNEIKLADIMASSSCFPAGFEPLKFPQDFRHEKSSELNRAVEELPTDSIAIMDGGIVDNQGIESILNYAENQHEHLKPELVIICDVGSPNVNPFEFNNVKLEKLHNQSIYSINRKALNSFRKYKNISLLIGLSALLSSVALIFFKPNQSILLALALAITFCSLASLYSINFLKRKFNHIKQQFISKSQSSLSPFYIDKLKYSQIDQMPIGKLINPILDRLESVFLMTTTIFLKRIRALSYDKLYSDERYKFKRISILIKSLKAKNSNQSKSDYSSNKINTELQNCPDVFKKSRSKVLGKAAKTISESSDFGTQLWFDEQDDYKPMLNKLISNGQLHTCYFLIKYILDLKDKPTQSGYTRLSPEDKRQITKIYNQCLKDWEKFRLQSIYNVHETV